MVGAESREHADVLESRQFNSFFFSACVIVCIKTRQDRSYDTNLHLYQMQYINLFQVFFT